MPKVIRCSSELDEEYTEGPTRALVQVFDCDTNIASHIPSPHQQIDAGTRPRAAAGPGIVS